MLKAKFFKLFFKIPAFRKHHFGLYTKVFRPRGWFRNSSVTANYDGDLKIRLDIGEWIQQQIYFLDVFDERGIRFIKNQLKEGDVFVDVGANIGCYTLIAAKLVGNGGKVHAFEPVSNVHQRLLTNLELNGFQNVIAKRKAVFEKRDTLKLHVSSDENIGMSGIYRHDTESGKIESVEAISLDEYVAENHINRIDLIKMDIEGAELFALKGMQKTLAELKPILVVEISDEVLENSPVCGADIIDFLEKCHYTRKAISAAGEPVSCIASSSPGYHNFAFFPE